MTIPQTDLEKQIAEALGGVSSSGDWTYQDAVHWMRLHLPAALSELRSLRERAKQAEPSIGSVWEWEPLSPHAATRRRVVVTDVKWNGEETMVEAQTSDGKRHWNDLSRWVEATVFVGGSSDKLND